MESFQFVPTSSVVVVFSNEKWTDGETWALLRVLVSVRSAFQNIRKNPGLWSFISYQLSLQGVFRSDEKCRNRWKVLVAKYKRCCGELVHTGQSSSLFEFFIPVQHLLSSQLKFTNNSLVRTFKNGAKIQIATREKELAPIRKLGPRKTRPFLDSIWQKNP